jgi:hypothetical protein
MEPWDIRRLMNGGFVCSKSGHPTDIETTPLQICGYEGSEAYDRLILWFPALVKYAINAKFRTREVLGRATLASSLDGR